MVLQPHSGDAFYSNEAAWLECAGLWKDYDKRREATTKLNGLAERYQEHIDDSQSLTDEALTIRTRILELKDAADQVIWQLAAGSLDERPAKIVDDLAKLEHLQCELQIQWKTYRRTSKAVRKATALAHSVKQRRLCEPV
jgi:hypothetical protein